MTSARQKTEELEKLRKKYELGGGQKAIDKVHARGKLTAREKEINLKFNIIKERE